MRKLLIPLLAALALPTACSNDKVSDKTVNAKIDPKIRAENLTSCPKDYDPDPYEMPKPGIIKVNVRKSIVDANNNESLREHLALLKLNAVENYSRFIKTEITSTPTKYGGERYTEKFDTSWDFMKKSIASMEEISICIKEKKYKKMDEIFFSGRWINKSLVAVQKIIKLEKAKAELQSIKREDPNFNLKELLKKHPNIFNTEDPKIILKAIDEWKKYRRF